ncbi:MAG TPA: CRTAC1 family protein [Bryobacteraceae bacterium]|jgi:hypothetical protein|nr:CRTAC1 family protein [Bryobacteraceae bacterium]
MRLRLDYLFLPLIVLSLLAGATNVSNLQFVDVAIQSGIHADMRCGGPDKRWITEANGSGAAWLDYDNDGLMDLLIVNGSTMEQLRKIVGNLPVTPLKNSVYLFHNLGNGKFEDVTERAGLSDAYWGTGANAADVNNDGFTDILITNIGVDLLYKNNGNGTFTEVSAAAGLSRKVAWHTGSAFGDFDGDGNLDLFVTGYVDIHSISLEDPAPVCPYLGVEAFCGPIGLKGERGILYHNNGNGTFTDITKRAGLGNVTPSHGFTVVADDFNHDGRTDIFVANDSDPNLLFLNKGDGTFKEAALEQGVAYNADGRVQSNMGVAIGDVQNQGRMGMVITTFFDDFFPFFRQDQTGNFDEVSTPSGLAALTKPYLGWACGFADFSNRGERDFWAANGHVYPKLPQYLQPFLVFENHGGKFSLGYKFPASPDNSYRGGCQGDFDNDGKLDVAVLPISGQPLLLRNQTENGNSWLGLRLRGTYSNRDAIGASVVVDACGNRQYDTVRNGGSYISANDPRLHFGLGACAQIDSVTVKWPRGGTQVERRLPVNKYSLIEEKRAH